MNARTIRAALLVVAILVAVTAPAAAVQTQTPAQTADQVQECSFSKPTDVEPLLDAYNENRDAAPQFVLNRISGERVEISITGETSFTYTVVFDENARALSAEQGSQNPTLRVTAEAQTLCDAATSEQPITALVDAYDAGEIDIEGTTPTTKITVTAVEIAIDLGRMFGLF